MASNLDIAVLAKQIVELGTLTPDQLEASKWEALLLIYAAYSSATPDASPRRTPTRRPAGVT